jgi:hypothetical protein
MATPIVEHDGKFYTNMAQFQQLVDDLEWLFTLQEQEM